MELTDRHYRYLARLMSNNAVLYTEMITQDAIIHGKKDDLLQYNDEEHPVVLQVGGNDPKKLKQCAKIAEDYGYDEINLNVGCPSSRVQSGMIGACLMNEKELVADCMSEMRSSCNINVTIKHRLGLGYEYSYDKLEEFVNYISINSNTSKFIIHSRNAILDGISPKQNREIPPIEYGFVHKIKQNYNSLEIIINGELKTIDDCLTHINIVDGAMVGRAAYYDIYNVLKDVDTKIYNAEKKFENRFEIILKYCEYMQKQNGVPLHIMSRHILGMFPGVKSAKLYRRYISENIYSKNATIDVIHDALKIIENDNGII